jgi:hypothetical protein
VASVLCEFGGKGWRLFDFVRFVRSLTFMKAPDVRHISEVDGCSVELSRLKSEKEFICDFECIFSFQEVRVVFLFQVV